MSRLFQGFGTRNIDTSGATIHLVKGGDGPPLLLLHGCVRCFADPATIHASCEDYRAAAGIDLEHDEIDLGRRIACPLLVLWGRHGTIERCFNPLKDWAERAENVRGCALDCGHYLPEEAPR